MIIAKEEYVFLVELALGKLVTCKLAAVSVTVPGAAVPDSGAWALFLVLELSSSLLLEVSFSPTAFCL